MQHFHLHPCVTFLYLGKPSYFLMYLYQYILYQGKKLSRQETFPAFLTQNPRRFLPKNMVKLAKRESLFPRNVQIIANRESLFQKTKQNKT